MTFLEHLEELRGRLIKGLVALAVGAVGAFIWVEELIRLLQAPIKNLGVELQALQVSDVFMVEIMVSVGAGLVVASPIIFYQLWRFVEPALGKTTRRNTLMIVLFSSAFFVGGIVFAYLVLLPVSLHFFTSLGAGLVESNFSIRSYLGYVVWMLLAAGMVFQLPILSLILTRVGLLTPPFLRHYRRYALVGILVLAAVLTPPDPLSQIMMAVPLLGLYELSILISRLAQPAG